MRSVRRAPLVLAVVAALAPALAFAQPRITAADGGSFTISVGARDGVKVGMTGTVRATQQVGGQLRTFDVAFEQQLVKPAAAAPAQPAGPPGGASAELDLAFWSSIKDSSDPADYEAYLKKFPNGTFADLARRRARGGGSAAPAAAPARSAAPAAGEKRRFGPSNGEHA